MSTRRERGLNTRANDLETYRRAYHDWHVHTAFTDGQDSVLQIATAAKAKGLGSIAVTEHVRRDLTYDFGLLVQQAHEAQRATRLRIFVGCEAKVLDDSGTLDVAEETLQQCELVLAAFHTFPQDKRAYLAAVRAMLRNRSVTIWAHPFRFARTHHIPLAAQEVEPILKEVRASGTILEINAGHLPSETVLRRIRALGIRYCFGSDAHSSADLLDAGFYRQFNGRLSACSPSG